MSQEPTAELAVVAAEKLEVKLSASASLEEIGARLALVKRALKEAMEEWREVPGYEGLYEVSNDGRVRRHIKSRTLGRGLPGRVLGTQPARKGYLMVKLYKGKKAKTIPVHRLVAVTFLGNPPFAKAQVNHVDGVKANNHALNLEWTTCQGNITHALSLGVAN